MSMLKNHPMSSPHRVKGRLILLSIVLGLVFASAASAQEATKIAVVDLDALFFSASEGTRLRDQLADLEKTTKAEVEAIEQTMRKIRQDAVGKSAIEQRDAARELEDAERQARRAAENAQRTAAKLEQTARASYNTRLEPLLREVQETEGFDLILNKTPGIVVFASTAIDVSQALLAKLEPGQ